MRIGGGRCSSGALLSFTLAFLLLGAIDSEAASYSIQTLIDFPGARETTPFGVNDADEVVGHYEVGSVNASFGNGFLLSNGVFSTIEAPNASASGTTPLDVNNNGQIAGIFSTPATHGFILESGVFSILDAPRQDDFRGVRLTSVSHAG